MDLLSPNIPSPIQQLSNPDTEAAVINLWVKRDDLIHPVVSGNKWRKLKYVLPDAKATGANTILTFGGSYSNHLYATAAAGSEMGLRTIGIVRGDELEVNSNPTLAFCHALGMELYFVSRTDYRRRNDPYYHEELRRQFGNLHIIPEGGTSELALKGVAEMVAEVRQQLGNLPDYIATAVGTGGSAAGILSAGCNALGFAALKDGNFLSAAINDLIAERDNRGQLTLFTEYHFGGYAKWTPELLAFMNQFRAQFGIQLEQVYTAKMFYGLFDLIKIGYFQPGTTIVAVHTGGLQGLIKE